jgi:hypothetical protein
VSYPDQAPKPRHLFNHCWARIFQPLAMVGHAFVRCPRLVKAKPILNLALQSCMLFNIDRCLGGGG